MNMKVKILSLVILSVSSYANAAYEITDIIQTPSGKYQGVKSDEYFQFKGIPYAEPPIKDRRWQAPETKGVIDGVFFAGKFGNSCATTVNLSGFSKISQSEDCLYLNVYSPKIETGKKYPVLFWIPGGGLRTGSGDEYDVSNFIKKDIVVVTINYRLGVFGFFSHPSLNKEAKKINYGLMDQQKALEWVKNNIDAFGGDPNNVTIFGESAGGHSVVANIMSPLSKGLFNKAIISSGTYNLDQRTVEEANKAGIEVAKIVGCEEKNESEQLECLKKVPSNKLITNQVSDLYNDQFTIDGTILPSTFDIAIKNGDFNKVNIINGFQNNEGTFFAGVIENGAGKKIDKELYIASMHTLFGKEFSTPEENEKNTDFTLKLSEDLTKRKFICPSLSFDKAISAKTNIYSYVFNDVTAPQYIPKMSIPYLASHTSELLYFFKGFHGATGTQHVLDSKQQELADNMVSYFSNFIKNGNPNEGYKLAVEWKPYTGKNKNSIEFSDKGINGISDVDANYECN